MSGFLGEKLGDTLASNKILDSFDFTVFTDLTNEYWDGLNVILNQSIFGLLLYLLLSVFLVGGILNVFKHQTTTYQLGDFWTGGGKYFWRMFRLMIYFLLIQGLILILFFTLYSSLTAGGLDRFHNEGTIIRRAFYVLPFYLLVATIFFMVHDYTKIHVVATDKSLLFRPIMQAIRWVFKNFSQTFLLYLLNLLTFGIFFFIYWKLDGGNAILSIFLIGQFFLLARIGTKLLNLASATALYQNSTQQQQP